MAILKAHLMIITDFFLNYSILSSINITYIVRHKTRNLSVLSHFRLWRKSFFCSFTFFVTHFEKLTFVSFEGIFKTFSSYFAEKIPFLDTLISWSLFMTFSELVSGFRIHRNESDFLVIHVKQQSDIVVWKSSFAT